MISVLHLSASPLPIPFPVPSLRAPLAALAEAEDPWVLEPPPFAVSWQGTSR